MSNDPNVAGLDIDNRLVCPDNVEAYTLAKVGTDPNTLALVTTSDAAADVVGIFTNARGAGSNAGVGFCGGKGRLLPMLTDGADALAPGDRVTVSTVADGRIGLAVTDSLGTVVSGADAVADAVVLVLYDGTAAVAAPGTASTLAASYIEGGGNAGTGNTLGANGSSMSEPITFKVNNAQAIAVLDSGGLDGDAYVGMSSSGDGQFLAKNYLGQQTVLLGGGVDQLIRAQNGYDDNAPGRSVTIRAGDGILTQTGGNVEIMAGGAASTGVLYATPPKIVLGIEGITDFLEYTLDPDGAGFPILRLASITGSYIQWGANMVIRAAAEVFIPYANGSYSFGYTSRYWRTIFNRLYITKTGASLTSASTITPTDGIHELTGTTTITTITVPSDFSSGTIIFIPTAAAVFNTGGNIGANFTATANVPVHATYDGTSWWLK